MGRVGAGIPVRLAGVWRSWAGSHANLFGTFNTAVKAIGTGETAPVVVLYRNDVPGQFPVRAVFSLDTSSFTAFFIGGPAVRVDVQARVLGTSPMEEGSHLEVLTVNASRGWMVSSAPYSAGPAPLAHGPLPVRDDRKPRRERKAAYSAHSLPICATIFWSTSSRTRRLISLGVSTGTSP